MLIDYLTNFSSVEDEGPVTKWYGSSPPNSYDQKEILIRDLKLREEVLEAMTSGFLRNQSFRFSDSYLSGSGNKSHIFLKHKPSNPELTERSLEYYVLQERLKVLHSLTWRQPFVLFGSQLQEDDKPRFLRIGFEDYPKSAVSELEELNSCSRTDHLVESPTGELFYIKWYGEEYEGEDLDEDENYNDVVRSVTHKTKKFMVFREKETGYAEENKNEVIINTEEDDKTMTYTEDIGDLCIFVGHSQAYCVPASSSPGLKPNCIYFVGYSFGVYDITTKTGTTFFTKEADEDDNEIVPLRRLDFPYWPPPFPISS
ncbi:hypothetical protein Bca4012_013321 [Brassica carinata]